VTPADLTEQKRLSFRSAALSSTKFMALVCGFHDLTPTLHADMALWLQGPGRRKLGLVPRGHLKSSLWTIADTVRLVTSDPDERILIINEVEENALAFLRRVRMVAERNTLWQWLFPERVPNSSSRWNDRELVFPRSEDYVEPSLAAVGVGNASTSHHYTTIKEDDLIGKEASEVPTTMTKAIDQHKLAEHLLVDPFRHPVQTFGTRWGNADLYDWMLKNEDPSSLSTFITGCYGPDGNPIWPERFPLSELERIRKKNGARLFSFQMLNTPIGEGATDFKESWLCYYTLDVSREGEPLLRLEKPGGEVQLVPLSHCTKFQSVDPGLSKDSRNARSAVVSAAITPAKGGDPFDIVLLGAKAKAVGPEQFTQLVRDEYLLWDPIVAGIEIFAAQKVYYQWLQRQWPDMRLTTFRTDTITSKETRIRSCSPYFEQRRVYVHRQMQDFVEEYVGFPTLKHKDLIDAFAYLPQLWFAPDPAEFEESENERIYERFSEGRDVKTGY
jgi:hypothetical protein